MVNILNTCLLLLLWCGYLLLSVERTLPLSRCKTWYGHYGPSSVARGNGLLCRWCEYTTIYQCFLWLCAASLYGLIVEGKGSIVSISACIPNHPTSLSLIQGGSFNTSILYWKPELKWHLVARRHVLSISACWFCAPCRHVNFEVMKQTRFCWRHKRD